MRLATIALALAVSGVGVATPAHAAAGQVRIRAQDSVNGAAITTFAVNGFGRYEQTETGELVLAGIEAGTYAVTMMADRYVPAQVPITVAGGGVTAATVPLDRSATPAW